MIPSNDDSITTEQHEDCSVCGTTLLGVEVPEWLKEDAVFYHQGTGEKFVIQEACKIQGPGRIWHAAVAARGELGQLECRPFSIWLHTMKTTPKPERKPNA